LEEKRKGGAAEYFFVGASVCHHSALTPHFSVDPTVELCCRCRSHFLFDDLLLEGNRKHQCPPQKKKKKKKKEEEEEEEEEER
jgi:hypothetical protein